MWEYENPIQLLEKDIFKELPFAHMEITKPKFDFGYWWLDVTVPNTDYVLTVTWAKGSGFGLAASTAKDAEPFDPIADEKISEYTDTLKRALYLLWTRTNTYLGP